jgi:ABC-type uncharacterized transport system ATPase subunit
VRRATKFVVTRTDHPRLVRLDEVLSSTAGVEKRANKAALLPMGEHQYLDLRSALFDGELKEAPTTTTATTTTGASRPRS